MLSSIYISIKSAKMNIFHANIRRGRYVFPLWANGLPSVLTFTYKDKLTHH